jgi:hypothetical protein
VLHTSGDWTSPALSRPVTANSILTERLDQACFGRGQQLREHGEVVAAGGTKLERGAHIDSDHMPARRGPQLALAGQQHFQGLMLLAGDQGVLAVKAEAPVGPKLASRAGQAVVMAGSAVFGPSGGLEVPAAEGHDPFLPRSAAPGGA